MVKKKKVARLKSVKNAEGTDKSVTVKARNDYLGKKVADFTRELQADVGKYGIRPEDLTVTVHLQIKETP